MRKALIVGSGGGTRGALFPFIYERIESDPQVTIGGMVGTSINAVHAYAVCTENTFALRGIWENIRGQQDFMRNDLNPLNGMYSLKPLRKLMLEQRWGMPVRDMFVGVFFFRGGGHRLVRCKHRPVEDVIDWVLASSSLAGIHNVFSINNEPVGDGGHHSPLPVPFDLWEDYNEVHILVSRPDGRIPEVEEKEVDGPIGQIARYSDYQSTVGINASLAAFRRMANQRPDIEFYLYRPRDWGSTGPTFERNDRELRRLIQRRLAHGEWMWENRTRL